MKFPIYFYLILTFDQPQKNVTTCPFPRVAKIINNKFFFLSELSFMNIHYSHGSRGRGRVSI